MTKLAWDKPRLFDLDSGLEEKWQFRWEVGPWAGDHGDDEVEGES